MMGWRTPQELHDFLTKQNIEALPLYPSQASAAFAIYPGLTRMLI